MMEGWQLWDVRLEFGQNSLTLSGLDLYDSTCVRKTATVSYRHIFAVETAFHPFDNPSVLICPDSGRSYWLALGELERGQEPGKPSVMAERREENIRLCLDAAQRISAAMERCA